VYRKPTRSIQPFRQNTGLRQTDRQIVGHSIIPRYVYALHVRRAVKIQMSQFTHSLFGTSQAIGPLQLSVVVNCKTAKNVNIGLHVTTV